MVKRKRYSDSYRPRDWEQRNRDQQTDPGAPRSHHAAARKPRAERDAPNLPPSSQRTTGLSEKIHSLRRLLQHESSSKMPADIRQEKERELSGYILDQQTVRTEKNKKKNLSRYHMVRFLERKRADRILKRLRKELEELNAPISRDNDDADGKSDAGGGGGASEAVSKAQRSLQAQMHRAQVDYNYTLFAPLGEKYISLFVEPEGQKKKIGSMTKADQNALTAADKDELLRRHDTDSGVLRSATEEKPPMWYRVEECMKAGTLEALRDGKLTGRLRLSESVVLPAVGAKKSKDVKSSWVQEGEVAPEDADRDTDMSDGEFFET